MDLSTWEGDLLATLKLKMAAKERSDIASRMKTGRDFKLQNGIFCLGKNVLAASNALACANMALAGFDAVIPLDQVVETMDRVGKSLPSELRCTGRGGLSVTQASKEIEERLAAAFQAIPLGELTSSVVVIEKDRIRKRRLTLK